MPKLALIDNYPPQRPLSTVRPGRFERTLGKLHIVRREELLHVQVRKALQEEYDGIVLTGSPDNVTDFGKPGTDWMTAEAAFIREIQVPLLGVCFGHQIICHAFGAHVRRIDAVRKEKMPAKIRVEKPIVLLTGISPGHVLDVEESHGQEVAPNTLPDVLENVAQPEPAWAQQHTEVNESVVQMVQHKTRPIFGTQFHPETFDGASEVLENTGAVLLKGFNSLCKRKRKMKIHG